MSSSSSSSSSSRTANAAAAAARTSSSSSSPAILASTSYPTATRPVASLTATDVVSLVCQFLREQGLEQSLATLQAESQVHFNGVSSLKQLASDITHGRWDAVLDTTAALSLPVDVLVDLHEHVALELCELGEVDTVRALLAHSHALAQCRTSSPARVARLEHWLSAPHFDASEAYRGQRKETRRSELAKSLLSVVREVPPSRLVTLLQQSLQWQRHVGLLPAHDSGVGDYDVVSGRCLGVDGGDGALGGRREDERVPAKPHKAVRFGKGSHAECVAFSPDGEFLVTGSVDGFVEVWNAETGKLRTDLGFQARDELMMHDDPVHCLAFSADSELLATGDAKGTVKVWRVKTGACVKRLPDAHAGSVSSVQFARNGTEVLTASRDQLVHIHGLKSGRALKVFRGHSSFVNAACYSEDGTQVLSVSSDGTLKTWDERTATCLTSVAIETPPKAVLGLSLLPHRPDAVMVVNRSNAVHVLAVSGGERLQQLSTGQPKDAVCAMPSPRGKFVFVVDEDSVLYCLSADDGSVQHVLKLHDQPVLAVAHHPFRNVFVSASVDGSCRIWKS